MNNRKDKKSIAAAILTATIILTSCGGTQAPLSAAQQGAIQAQPSSSSSLPSTAANLDPASVATPSSAGVNLVSSMGSWAAQEKRAFELVNEARTHGTLAGKPIDPNTTCLKSHPAGVQAVLPVEAARIAAMAHARYLGNMGMSAHAQPVKDEIYFYGSTFSNRIERAIKEAIATKGEYNIADENVYAGPAESAEAEAISAVDGWLHSPSHCSSMMNPLHRYAGISVFHSNLKAGPTGLTVYPTNWVLALYY